MSYNCEIPTDEELSTSIKALIFPGSAHAVHNPSSKFVPTVSAMIRNVMDNYKHIKLFGSCFGHQIFAHALGGQTEQMRDIDPARQKIIGREHIECTDDFFALPYIQKYMIEKGFTKQTMPEVVMQQSHGDHVCVLPPSATLLGFSSTCKIEMFSVGMRLLCC